MQDLALYRKYRPKVLDQIIGQDHIVSVLKNEVEKNKISHAYLFSGSRGTGKTSLARIFAEMIGAKKEDVYEIDAASNRGINEIRELRDSVNTFPYSSKYKVYIIDEVHMLTREAWNAFLKTLEEPPSHVVFILATTELQKVLDTVISRCECFAFKKPNHLDLTNSILDVAKKEGYDLEQKSASLIANLAEGSFRDAFSILQKSINSSLDKKLSHLEIVKVLGAPDDFLVLDLLKALADKKTDLALECVRRAENENIDMEIFLKIIIRYLRFILLFRFAPDMKKYVVDQIGEEIAKNLMDIVKNAKNINSKTLLNFLEASNRQAYASVYSLPVEIAIIESTQAEKE